MAIYLERIYSLLFQTNGSSGTESFFYYQIRAPFYVPNLTNITNPRKCFIISIVIKSWKRRAHTHCEDWNSDPEFRLP
jgi:hypothetical protein